MVATIIAGVALAASLGSLTVSILSYRSSGARVSVLQHILEVAEGEARLEAKLVNSGREEIDIDGATCDLLGPTGTVLPHRMKSGSSIVLIFRARIGSALVSTGSVTLNVGLGNGRSLVRQVRFTEAELALIRASASQDGGSQNRGRLAGRTSEWTPPWQEEI